MLCRQARRGKAFGGVADVWTGGVSEIRRVADFTAAFQRSFTPIGLAVGTRVSL